MPADRPKRSRNRASVLSPPPTPTPEPLGDDETVARSNNLPNSPYEDPAAAPDVRPPPVFSQPDNPEGCALEAVEAEIDWAVLHPTESASKERKGAAAFKRSVMGLQKIVSEKLYRVTATSVQAYFKNRFELTRAQAYRFIDCAVVLDNLSGLKHPTRERLCRCLKKTCVNKVDMRTVWLKALAERQNDPERINSSLLESLANDLRQEKEGRGIVKGESGNPSTPRINGALRKTPTKQYQTSSSPAPVMGSDGYEDGFLRVKEEGNSTGSAPPSVGDTPDPFLKGESDEIVPTEDYGDSMTESSEEDGADDSDDYVPTYQSAASRLAAKQGGIGTRSRGRPRKVPRSPESGVEPPKRRGGSVGSSASTNRNGKTARKGLLNVKKEGSAQLPSRPGSSKSSINMEQVVHQEGQSAASILQQFSQIGFELQPLWAQAWRSGITEWRVSTVTNPPPGCVAVDDQGDVMAWEGALEAELERVMEEVVNSASLEASDDSAMMMAVDPSFGGAAYPQIMMHHPSTAIAARTMQPLDMPYLLPSTLAATMQSMAGMPLMPYSHAMTVPPLLSVSSVQSSMMQPAFQQSMLQAQQQQSMMAPPSSSQPMQPPSQQPLRVPLPTPPPTNAKPSPNRMLPNFSGNDGFVMTNLSGMQNIAAPSGGNNDFLFNDVFGNTLSDLNSNSNAADQQSSV